MFSRFFIDRPIFAIVIAIMMILVGVLTIETLPVAQFPDITPPTVQVSASYPGADAETVASTIAAPIEEQVNGLENMMYMSSSCGSDGSYSLTITFEIEPPVASRGNTAYGGETAGCSGDDPLHQHDHVCGYRAGKGL